MSLIGFTPHHNQAKKSKYPKTRKLASPGEKVQFFILGCYKIFKLMDMGSLRLMITLILGKKMT
ncbi:hypothetical protein EXW49_28780 (plasmid) [Bacillus mycoides]|nr:hypothetical protein EXW52_29415 [Bacillus mycoides]QWH09924.1 hypothetical protein EXW49_28780 [Bacillus mycoides]